MRKILNRVMLQSALTEGECIKVANSHEELRYRYENLSMLIRRMNRMAGRDQHSKACRNIHDLYIKAEHLLSPAEILRVQPGTEGKEK